MKAAVLLFPALLLACGGPALSTPGTTGEVGAAGRPVVRVEEALLEPSAGSFTITLSGEVEGSRDALLAAPLGGYVEAVEVREGQAVREGQVLARIDATTWDARRDQAAAQAAQAAAEHQRVLAMGDLVSPAQLLAAETVARVAEAGLRLAETSLSRALVRAPFDGVVGQVTLEVGEVAPPGSPVCRLVRLDPVKVVVSVADREVGRVAAGVPVTVTTEARPDTFRGAVTGVSPTADPRSRAFKAEIEVANPDGALLPGMIARVLVEVSAAEDAVLLPQDAVVTRLDGVGAFVDESGVARWRWLELGDLLHDAVVVRSGLAVGDRVVTLGHRELADGDPLLVQRTGTCCTSGRVTY